MDVHVLNGGQQIGPFPVAAVADMARNGALESGAMVWHDGAPEWYPLTRFLQRPEVVAVAGAPAAAPALSGAELKAEILRQKRAALEAEAGKEGVLVLRALAAGFGVALLGGLLYLGTFLLTRPLLIPGPIIVIGMVVGSTITKVGRGEGSILLPAGSVLFTLMAYLMVGCPLTWVHLLFLGMGLFMAFKLAYL